MGPSQPLSRKPTQEPRDPETVVAYRVRRSAGLNQRPQPVTRPRMNHPAPPVEHDGEVHFGSGPHPTKPERSRGNHGSSLRAATDSEADVSTTKKNQPVTDNRGRCSMATDKQRQLGRVPPAPERRRGGAGVRCGRGGRTPRRLVLSGGRPVAGAVAGGGPPSWPACAVGRLGRTAVRTLSAGDRGRAAAEVRDSEWRPGVLMGVRRAHQERASAGAAGCGSSAGSAGLRRPWLCSVYDVLAAVLTDCTCPLRPV